MKAIIFTALIAVCSSANLNRSYLPPSTAKEAGGSSDNLQPPNLLPIGSYENEHQGVVVDVAVGIRTSDPALSGLGAPRVSYGSTNSKVGDAAFRDKHLQGGSSFLPQGFVDFNRPERVQASRDRISNVVRFENNLTPETYNYFYETDNGISVAEKAVSVDGVKSEGGYSYTGDDGQVYTVTYTADEDGFRPKGAHLPTPPPIPAEILRSLEKNAKDEAAGLFDDGSYDPKKYNTAGDYSDSSDNDRYNDRQSNKVASRPGYNTPSSSFINQNNQAFKPNFDTQSGILNNVGQTDQIKFQASQIPSGNTANPAIQTNPTISNPDVTQANFISSNRFGESNPLQGYSQQAIPIGQYYSQQTVNSTVIPASQEMGIPLSQQPLQNEDNRQDVSSGKPYGIPSTNQGATFPPLDLGGNPLTTMLTQTSDSSDHGNIKESFKETKPSDTITTIIPTNQPSRELTTPFEASVMSNVGSDRKPANSFSSPTFETAAVDNFESPQGIKPSNGQQTQLTNTFEDKLFNYNKPSPNTIFQKPLTQGLQNKLNINRTPIEQSILTQQPNNSYEGEIYHYNKPIVSQESPNIQQGFAQKPPAESFIQDSDTSQQISTQSTPTNELGNNEQVPNSETVHNIPTLSSKTDIRQNPENFEKLPTSQPLDQQSGISTISSEIYEYNKPTSIIPGVQNPLETNFVQSSLNNAVSQIQSYNADQAQNVVGSFMTSNSKQPVLQTSFGSRVPSIIEQNYSSQPSNSIRDQGTPSTDHLSLKPSQSTFLQPQPTIPSFGQITIYQLRPQISGGIYNYDIPVKPFQQQNPSPFNTEHIKPTSQSGIPSTTGQIPISYQNNGITQATISAFAPITATQQNPSDSQLNSKPSATFAQAVSSEPFPTLQSFIPQEPVHIQQIERFNTNEAEVYQYTKPKESFPSMPELSHSQKIETPPINGQLNPQFTLSLDNKGSVVEKIEFKPVSLPQGLASLPDTPQSLPSEQSKLDQNKPEVSNVLDSRPIGSTIIGSPCCSGHMQEHKHIGKPETNRNELNAQSLMPQEASSTIKGEQFDVNRKPSTFDSTGYHY